jgi:hypothetical protein
MRLLLMLSTPLFSLATSFSTSTSSFSFGAGRGDRSLSRGGHF